MTPLAKLIWIALAFTAAGGLLGFIVGYVLTA